ncbi:MAG TPA: hypothetical protein VL688_00170 [Verrucomicrobiae bacterium]|jgi:hypothetical protein|nr:hypothetical protein [Verrucomicrobiae bacterium]
MKTARFLVAFLVLVPAVLFACHCPAMAQDGTLKIQKTACSCCSKTVIARDCGSLALKEKADSPAPQNVFVPAAPSREAPVSRNFEASLLSSSPPQPFLDPFAFSSVLRI